MRFALRGGRTAVDRKAPFKRRLRVQGLRRGQRATVIARVSVANGGLVVRQRGVRRCGYVDTIAYKVANGDPTARQGAARSLSSR